MGEDFNDSQGYNPIEIKLYDLIIQKKSSSFLKATQGRLGANDEPFQITIAEMLKNVKDSNRQPFINKDGTLSQGINFYANNDRNYHSQKKIS